MCPHFIDVIISTGFSSVVLMLSQQLHTRQVSQVSSITWTWALKRPESCWCLEFIWPKRRWRDLSVTVVQQVQTYAVHSLHCVSVKYDAFSLCFISQEQRHPLVAGSVGPYGAFLLDGSEYTGAYAEEMSVEVCSSQMLILVTNEVIMQMFIQMFHLWTHLLWNFFFSSSKELKAWHRPHVECLAAAGADLVAFETIPSIKEAEALVELLREFPNSKAWLAFSCKVTTAAEQYN